MANIDAPSGLRHCGRMWGGPDDGQIWKCYTPTTDANNWFIGDPVVITGAYSSTDGFYPGVDLASQGDGNPITGIIMSFEPPSGYENYKYRVASKAWHINVCFDPYSVYEVQTDDDDVGFTYTHIWTNACLASGTGSAYTGLSGWELDGDDTPAADSSNQVILLGFARYPNNEIATVHSKWNVYLSHSQLIECTTAGDGILGVA